jgi:hypothetical protein
MRACQTVREVMELPMNLYCPLLLYLFVLSAPESQRAHSPITTTTGRIVVFLYAGTQ